MGTDERDMVRKEKKCLQKEYDKIQNEQHDGVIRSNSLKVSWFDLEIKFEWSECMHGRYYIRNLCSMNEKSHVCAFVISSVIRSVKCTHDYDLCFFVLIV